MCGKPFRSQGCCIGSIRESTGGEHPFQSLGLARSGDEEDHQVRSAEASRGQRDPLGDPLRRHRRQGPSGRTEGRFVARVDFAWPEHKVAVEYDGLWHAEAGQFARDRQRLNRLQAAGWRVVFVTAADLRHPEALIARIAPDGWLTEVITSHALLGWRPGEEP